MAMVICQQSLYRPPVFHFSPTKDFTLLLMGKMCIRDRSISFSWDINYPMSQLIERAALNTVMGLGIVFLTLLFLSWLIGKLHIIPVSYTHLAPSDREK